MTAGDEAPARIEDEATAWLSSLRSGQGDQAAFEIWYSSDPAHAAAYDAVLASWEAMAMLGPAAVPAATSRPPQVALTGRRRAIITALAAALVLAVFAAGVGGFWPFGAQPAEAVVLVSRIGEIRTVRLADGTVVTLDSDTALSGSVSSQGRSFRLLRGRARFAVAAASSQPLVVESGAASVSGSDTVFDVGVGDGALSVGALRGSPEIRSAQASQHLSAGQIVTLRGDGVVVGPRVLRASETRWTTGMLSFENARLGDVVAAANRYAAIKIVVEGNAAELRFTGTIRPTRTDALAKMLAATFGLDLVHDPVGNYLLARRVS
jgi:transmembrane sensor